MTARKYDQGGVIPGGPIEVLVIPYADRGQPLPSGWDPLLVIAAEECIVKLNPLRCVRSDHPHGDPLVTLDPVYCADGCGRLAERERPTSCGGSIELVCNRCATLEAR